MSSGNSCRGKRRAIGAGEKEREEEGKKGREGEKGREIRGERQRVGEGKIVLHRENHTRSSS